MEFLDQDEPTGFRGWLTQQSPAFWLSGIITIAFVALFIGMLPEFLRPYSVIHVRAAPYVWSKQCPKRIIHAFDVVEESCVREEYRFTDDTKKLLSYGRSKSVYYRFGNDLATFFCQTDNCTVQHVYTNAYYQ